MAESRRLKHQSTELLKRAAELDEKITKRQAASPTKPLTWWFTLSRCLAFVRYGHSAHRHFDGFGLGWNAQ